ncbi:hypothetical protein RFI_03704 [Reticulomyxa filosa]|uniref:Cullin family profile domain-containing protein n=1 Tax=Reticulomyxa filosa TaxID=46433 RepID=X6P5F7_RETFI|nr:hypothetical protein RFI_03704 [Reticulomyxa filosa]|eukprot:ETO33401.1 hypothetical protein RFI_03704 [Reticulomyxa filosa]
MPTEEMEEEMYRWQPDPIESDLRTKDDPVDGNATEPNAADDAGSAPTSSLANIFRRDNMDIIAMLVKIFGNSDIFVEEYRKLLGDRLFHSNCKVSDIEATNKEVEYLELMKLRFGDESLQQCDVMIKDLEQSRRLNSNTDFNQQVDQHLQHISQKTEIPPAITSFQQFDAKIISAHYWPSHIIDTDDDRMKMLEKYSDRMFRRWTSYVDKSTEYKDEKQNNVHDNSNDCNMDCDDKSNADSDEDGDDDDKDAKKENLMFNLPQSLQNMYSAYDAAYRSTKNPRKLIWMPTFGSVELELELAGNCIDWNTIPTLCFGVGFYAGLSLHLCMRIRLFYLSIGQEIKQALKLTEAQIVESLTYWQRCGVVKKCGAEKHLTSAKNDSNLYRLCNSKEEEMQAYRIMLKVANSKGGENGNNGRGSADGANDVLTDDLADELLMMSTQNFTRGLQNPSSEEEKTKLQLEFETCILQLLSTFQSQSVENIFNLLKQMKLNPQFSKMNIYYLQKILDQMAADNRIIHSDGIVFTTVFGILFTMQFLFSLLIRPYSTYFSLFLTGQYKIK